MAAQPSFTENAVAADLGNNVIPLRNCTLPPSAVSLSRTQREGSRHEESPASLDLGLGRRVDLGVRALARAGLSADLLHVHAALQGPRSRQAHLEKKPPGYVETLPSGRRNTFRIQKEATVNGQRGLILQKVEEPNFFVFIADGDASRMDLWWLRDKGPWNYMGRMDQVSAPHNID